MRVMLKRIVIAFLVTVKTRNSGQNPASSRPVPYVRLWKRCRFEIPLLATTPGGCSRISLH